MAKEASAKILLVDDLSNNLLALRDILEDVDAELLCASDGNEALLLATQHDLALILLDVQMPGMDGFEVASHLRRVERTRRIPIIFITALSRDTETIFKGYEVGAVDYIHKPIIPEILKSKTQIFLELYYQKLQLQHQQDELELRVAERTAELQVALSAANAADQAKTEFLGNMTHELKTPMNSVIGFTRRLIRHLDGVIGEKDFTALRTVEASSLKMLDLINMLLDMSKIKSGKQLIENARCSTNRLLRDVVVLMSVQASEKGLSLELENDGPIPTRIETDPTRLRQILINLVGNAIKFTETGFVRVVVRLLEPTGESPRLQIDVIDSGIGICEEAVGELFKPFVQADSSTARKYGGTGLGLTISKQFAALLGGEIQVRSALGEGSTFSVSVNTGPLEGVPMFDNLNGPDPDHVTHEAGEEAE